MNEIVIFEADRQRVEVRLEGETLWLTQKQMGELYATSPENVLIHLKNIFKDNELVETATVKDFLVVQQEGARQVSRDLKHYNLDAIISVGYRGYSTQATRFRQWATRILREHPTQGYSLNEHRLARQGWTNLTGGRGRARQNVGPTGAGHGYRQRSDCECQGFNGPVGDEPAGSQHCTSENPMSSAPIISKVWSFCTTLRDDGVKYGDYL